MIKDKQLLSEYRAYEIMSELLKKWLDSDRQINEKIEIYERIEDEYIGMKIIMSEIYMDDKHNE